MIELNIGTAIIFFGLGIAQGVIIRDWILEKQTNKILTIKKKGKK